MRIAVTGAAGQLGREVCRLLGEQALPLEIDTLDLTDRAAVLAYLPELKPDAVINCAAYTAVDQAEHESARCYAANATAVEHLAEACAGAVSSVASEHGLRFLRPGRSPRAVSRRRAAGAAGRVCL